MEILLWLTVGHLYNGRVGRDGRNGTENALCKPSEHIEAFGSRSDCGTTVAVFDTLLLTLRMGKSGAGVNAETAKICSAKDKPWRYCASESIEQQDLECMQAAVCRAA